MAIRPMWRAGAGAAASPGPRELGKLAGAAPEAAALFVQAMTFGRVIDDVSSRKIDEQSWDEAFIFIMKKTILDD